MGAHAYVSINCAELHKPMWCYPDAKVRFQHKHTLSYHPNVFKAAEYFGVFLLQLHVHASFVSNCLQGLSHAVLVYF